MYNTDELSLFSVRAQKGLCSHAYIVDGEKGIGKLEFALQCARAMLCTGTSKPCNYCENCRKAIGNNHPDIFIIGNEKTASIAEVRELIRRSSLKPNDADKQIFIVCNAGKLREDAQNALLKLFEEPPESVAIFLLTESRSSLLPTVLSRGQRIHLDGMRDDEIANRLREKYSDISKGDMEDAVRFAGGNIGKAENYLSKESISLRKKAENLLLAVLSKENYDLCSQIILSKYKREQLHALLNEFVFIINEALKKKYGILNNISPKNSECSDRLKNANKKALASMGEAATVCMTALENNANVTAVSSKLVIDLIKASNK